MVENYRQCNSACVWGEESGGVATACVNFWFIPEAKSGRRGIPSGILPASLSANASGVAWDGSARPTTGRTNDWEKFRENS